MQEFLTTYGIDLDAVKRIAHRIMVVGRFNHRDNSGEIPVYLFTNKKVEASFAALFSQPAQKIKYENFVKVVRPAIAEFVAPADAAAGRPFASIEQVVPSDGSNAGNVSVIDTFNYFFKRAVSNSEQEEFKSEAGGSAGGEMLARKDLLRGKDILKQIRSNLNTFGKFQPRTHELVTAASAVLGEFATGSALPATYESGGALPTGFGEAMVSFLYDEDVSRGFEAYVDRLSFDGPVWGKLPEGSKTAFCEILNAFRLAVMEGHARGFESRKSKGGKTLADVAGTAVSGDRKALVEAFRESRSSYNSLRQIVKSKVLISMVLEWIVAEFNTLRTVKDKETAADKSEAAGRAIMSDWEANGLARPIMRPSETERAKFRDALTSGFDQVLDAVLAKDDAVDAMLAPLPAALKNLVKSLRTDPALLDTLKAVSGATLNDEMKRAFTDAAKNTLVDLMLPVLYANPLLTEQDLLRYFRAETEAIYMNALFLQPATQEKFVKIAEGYKDFFQKNIDEQTKTIGKADEIRSRLLGDYLRTLTSPEVAKQVIEGREVLRDVLFLLDAAAGTERQGAGDISAIRPSGKQDPLQRTADSVEVIRVVAEKEAAAQMKEVQAAANAVPHSPPAAVPQSPDQLPSVQPSGGEEEARQPAQITAPKAASETGKSVGDIRARVKEKLNALLKQDPAALNTEASQAQVVKKLGQEVLKDAPLIGGLTSKLRAFEKTLHLIYTTYADNQSRTAFRNNVDRMTLINVLLLNKADLSLGNSVSSLYEMLLDVVKFTDPENPEPMQFLSRQSLTKYFDIDNWEVDFAGLRNTLTTQATRSMDNVVRFISELRSVKLLMDKVGADPDAEIVLINATATEFSNWVKNDNLVNGQGMGRLRCGGLTVGANPPSFPPAMIYMTDLAFAQGNSDRSDAGPDKAAWLRSLASAPLSAGGFSVIMPPICVSTAVDDWRADGQNLVLAAAEAPAAVLVVGPPPRMNPQKDGFPTFLPAGYLLAAHLLTSTAEPKLKVPNQASLLPGRLRAIGYSQSAMNESLRQAIWSYGLPRLGERPADAEGSPDGYCFAADFYLYLALTLWGTAHRRGGMTPPTAAEFYPYFYFSVDPQDQDDPEEFDKATTLNPAMLGGNIARFAMATNLATHDELTAVYVASGQAKPAGKMPPTMTDVGWYNRAKKATGLTGR